MGSEFYLEFGVNIIVGYFFLFDNMDLLFGWECVKGVVVIYLILKLMGFIYFVK